MDSYPRHENFFKIYRLLEQRKISTILFFVIFMLKLELFIDWEIFYHLFSTVKTWILRAKDFCM